MAVEREGPREARLEARLRPGSGSPGDLRVVPGVPGVTREEIKGQILHLVRQYAQVDPRPSWRPGDKVPYAGRVLGAEEMINLVEASLECWLTLGGFGERFEKGLETMLGVRDVILVNSGSSANLVALSALCSEMLKEPLRPGDEVVTPAVTFPTTLAPIVQNGLIPVFVDCDLGTYNANVEQIEAAIGPKTRAIVLPHTLGNVFDVDRVSAVAKKAGAMFVEDTCDALGSTWNGKPVGTFGDYGTISFYPAHHITMGEGGAVVTSKALHARVARSVRDWGRDCWCDPGVSNTCQKRFGWQLGDLPKGYDHKYIYSNIGYNLKPTDLQAAVGLAQLDRLPEFVRRRRANFDRLYAGLRDLEEHFILPVWDARAEVSWFAFPLTVRPKAPFTRDEVVRQLESKQIETRMIFAGNVLRQPAYRKIARRVVGELRNTDLVMTNTFFVGVYPGLTDAMIDYVVEEFHAFARGHRAAPAALPPVEGFE
ncbi:MAG: lipopolysaccharide biosynthesis protein RfbH [Planctomycetes bacterium]|nr:lipopolysaccharide biosynthesis protein RfbH [Planctomycetota bacterium]